MEFSGGVARVGAEPSSVAPSSAGSNAVRAGGDLLRQVFAVNTFNSLDSQDGKITAKLRSKKVSDWGRSEQRLLCRQRFVRMSRSRRSRCTPVKPSTTAFSMQQRAQLNDVDA